MAQDTVERLLGRILTDGRFRAKFFAQAREELREYDLLDHERESLIKLDHKIVEQLSEKLDPRIVRG
jgi:hypothetical protein